MTDLRIETSEIPLAPPDEYSASDTDASTASPDPASKAAVDHIKDEIFDRIAKDESPGAMERYVAERRDIEAEERGEKLSPERERDRLGRYTRALEAAGQEMSEIVETALKNDEEMDNSLARRDASVARAAKHEMRVRTVSAVASRLPGRAPRNLWRSAALGSCRRGVA